MYYVGFSRLLRQTDETAAFRQLLSGRSPGARADPSRQDVQKLDEEPRH